MGKNLVLMSSSQGELSLLNQTYELRSPINAFLQNLSTYTLEKEGYMTLLNVLTIT